MSEVIERAPDLDLAKVKRWRNLWFRRDWATTPGTLDYDSQEAALKTGQRGLEYCKRFPDSEVVDSSGSFFCFASEISHFIPMPAGDA